MRVRRALASWVSLAAFTFGASGCGGAKSPPATSTPDAGFVATPEPDGGPSADAGIPAASNGASDGGAGGAAGAMMDGGIPDGGSTQGAAPVGGDSGADVACAGLLPQAPGLGVDAAEQHSVAGCGNGSTDGTGDFVALPLTYKYVNYAFYPAAGGALAGGAQAGFGNTAPQPSGYHVIDNSPGQPGPFRALDRQGDQLAEGGTLGAPWIIAGDPAGGSVLFTTTYGRPGPSRVETMDASGHRRGATEVDREIAALAVAATGDALALADGSARWFDRKANPVTPWFAASYLSTRDPARHFGALVLAPLADGSVALSQDGDWKLLFKDGVASAEPSPDWLTSRPDTLVTVVRGGRANAFVPWPKASGPPCTTAAIEILTDSGRACGTVKLPGETCQLLSLSIGKDGTAIALDTASVSTCHWRWWSGLLR